MALTKARLLKHDVCIHGNCPLRFWGAASIWTPSRSHHKKTIVVKLTDFVNSPCFPRESAPWFRERTLESAIFCFGLPERNVTSGSQLVSAFEGVGWPADGRTTHFENLLRIWILHEACYCMNVILPALQKHFVNIFFVFAWEFCIEKWRGFLVNFFWSPLPTKRSTKNPRKIRGKFGAKFGAKFGTKIQKIRGAFVLELVWPKWMTLVDSVAQCWATPRYGWDFPEEIPEKLRKDPGNALRTFPGIPLKSTAGIPQAL